MSELKLGQIIEEPRNRDAIHVAVAPVSSNETLYPGQHVGLIAGSVTEVGTMPHAIGVVDPFLTHKVTPGQKFWLFLYPQTVTSLRHEWTHPAFDAPSAAPLPNPVAESKAWLEDIAKRCGVTYERMMDAIERDGYIHMGENEAYRAVIDDVCDELQRHSEIVLGRKLSGFVYPFSCSC